MFKIKVQGAKAKSETSLGAQSGVCPFTDFLGQLPKKEANPLFDYPIKHLNLMGPNVNIFDVFENQN